MELWQTLGIIMSYKEHWKEEEEAIEEDKKHALYKIKFDPTINLGAIISFVTFLVLSISVYNALDKRVLVLETGTSKQELRDLTQDADRARINIEAKEAFVDIKHGVERLSDKLDQQQQQQQQQSQDKKQAKQ